MPRGKVNPSLDVEFLSVLDEAGELDDAHDPRIEDDRLLRTHRAMLLARRFDERLLSLQRQGRIGTFAPVKGQEAAQIGTISAIEESDWMVPSYRETAASLWRGTPMEGLLLYFAGYNEGGAIPEGQNDLPVAIPVGTQMLHAVGIGYGIKLRGEDRCVMTYFGDGATSQGDFHEAMNFAGVFQTPTIFVCQNNQWAISVPRDRQTHSKTLAQKALAYDIPGMMVDGNDLLAVHAVAREAVERARSGGGPTMIECVTYRLEVHTTADDPTKYRTEEEVEKWRKRDPLPRLQALLKKRDLLSDDDMEGLEEEIERDIRAAVEAAEKRAGELGDPSIMFEHLYAERAPTLNAQREEFAGRPSAGSPEAE